jgi:hypothetical protein
MSVHEEGLRQLAKHRSLGLSSLQRTITRQEWRMLWFNKGDATTRFFHVQANSHAGSTPSVPLNTRARCW